MAKIRPLEHDDIPKVVALRRKSFHRSEHGTDESLGNYLKKVFLEAPWSGHEARSVVCESKGGEIVGFHGRFRKRMQFAGKEAKLTTGTQLMVDPGAGGFPGIQLLQELFRGDHDLFLADGGNEASRQMWEALNADVVHVESLTWALPLRPHYHLRHLGKSLPGQAGRYLVRKILDLTTPAARRESDDGDLNAEGPKGYRTQPVTPETMAQTIAELAGKKAIVPIHQPAELHWIFEHIEEGDDETPINRIVIGPDGQTSGWFSYQPQPGAVARVLGIMAQDGAYDSVLDALVADASLRRFEALRGRVEARYLNELGRLGCEITRSGPWVLAHSKNPEILRAVHRGYSKFTLLDGERWLRF